MICVWEKERSMTFLFMGKLLAIWRGVITALGNSLNSWGAPPTTGSLDLTLVLEIPMFRVPSYGQFPHPSCFPYWIISVVELDFTHCWFVILYNPKKWVPFEEFGSSQFVQIIQCLATLHITAVPSFHPWGQRAQRKLLPEPSGFTGWLKFFMFVGSIASGASVPMLNVGKINIWEKHSLVTTRDWCSIDKCLGRPGVGLLLD